MDKKFYYTDDEAKRLRDCEVQNFGDNEWRKGYKFLRRARQTATVLQNIKSGTWCATSRSVFCVKVDGKVLPYLTKYEFTNPKNPFKTEDKNEQAKS